MHRRQALLGLAGLAALAALPRLALAGGARQAVIGAAWRGPNKTDPYFAGALVADWDSRTLAIRYAVPLPTRPHGLLAEADGGLLVLGARPGAWLLRCDGAGRVTQQVRVDEEGATRLNGHAVASAGGDALYTTETELKSGRGRIGVRDRLTLRKRDEWDTHGIDPHQLLLDGKGHLVVANGGVPRTPEDKKFDLHRMEPSLARLDGAGGRLLGQWRLDDPRLSLRHLAWSRNLSEDDALLGIALQAEHDEAAARAAAPIPPCSTASASPCRPAPTTASATPATSPPPITAASRFPATRPGNPCSGIPACPSECSPSSTCRKPMRSPPGKAPAKAAAC